MKPTTRQLKVRRVKATYYMYAERQHWALKFFWAAFVSN